MAAVNILTEFKFGPEGGVVHTTIERHITVAGRAYLRKVQELSQQFANQAGFRVTAARINIGAAPGLFAETVVAMVYPEEWGA